MRHLLTLLFTLLFLGCARAPEENAARYLREGRDFAAKKDYPRAILQFKNASKFLPKNAEPYYQLGLVAIAMGDTAGAAEFLNRAITLKPGHVDAMLALSDLLTRSAHLTAVEEGSRLAQRALTIVPGDLKALNMIALADLRTGHAKAAAARLEDMLRRFPNHSETAINLARVLLTLKDRNGAEQLLQKTAASAPGDVAALFALADFYGITGEPSKSVEWYQRGLRIQPDNAQALAALGRLQANAGNDQEADAAFARLSQNPDRRFRYAYAMRLLSSGRKDAAAAALARIFNDNPQDREARTHLINAYLDSGRIPEAEELLAKAIGSDPKDVDALRQRARVHLSRRRPESAETDLNIVLQYRPESAEAYYLRSQVHRDRQNLQLQLADLAEALRLDPHYSAARVELSRSLMRKDPQKALDVIDSAPEEQYQNIDFRIQRIWPLIELKRLDEARTAIDALLDAGSPEVLLQGAVLCMILKDFSGGMRSAQKALLANPADVRALEVIIRSALGEKQPAQGIEFIRRHASQNRNLAAVQVFLGGVEFQAGNAAQARAAFEAAKAADPGILEADWGLIDLDIAEQKLDSARRRIALLMHGSTEALATARLALVEQRAGNWEAASRQYRRVLALKPSDAGVLNNLAFILTESLGNPNEALQYAQTAKELEPENAAIDDTLGWTYYRMGRYREAVRHLELAVKRTPNARRHAHLAMAYARHGDTVRARQMLQTALMMDPNLPEASLAKRVVAGDELQNR